MIKIILPEVHSVLTPSQSTALNIFERAARTCYQSFSSQKDGSAEGLLSHCISSDHHSTLEHLSATLRFITSRGVTHELVRHRLCAFSQESTRYVRNDGEVQVIKPYWLDLPSVSDAQRELWKQTILNSINNYQWLLTSGLTPQAARGVLPNDIKTEIVVTANLREWRHILSLRLEKDAHPDMRLIMQPTAQLFMTQLPLFFCDLEVIKKRYHEEL